MFPTAWITCWTGGTAILQRVQLEGSYNDAHTLKSKVCSYFLAPYFGLRQVILHHKITFKIKAINDRLDVIANEKGMYNFVIATERPQRVETTSFIDVSDVFGRDNEKKDLVGKLLHESCEERNDLHIISIVGMGGIGKTTLAQLAYNNDEVINFFEKRIWVCVSDPFDKLAIAKAIFEALEGDASNLSRLQSILEKIGESIRRKKFLIVLDDVWTEEKMDWEPFHHCLKNGLLGSKVLVTTRKQTTALILKSIDIIPIEELSDKHCWSLFRQLAFFGRSIEESEKLEEIGRKIVSKCKGLPLAAKTLGSLLRFKSTRKEWENILNSEMWKVEEFEKGVVPSLLLSYYDLPSMIKRCFTYCAIFPKDFKFEKDELVRLWMAQGYLGLDHNEELEIVGEKYFNSLALRSFFQEFEKDKDGSIIRCKMHDIVHDVAQFLSKNECCVIEVKDHRERNILALCEKARHLMCTVSSRDTFPLYACDFKKLQTLLIQYDDYEYNELIKRVPSKLFDELTCLRVLRIPYGHTYIENIPKGLGNLIHLRYLDLSNNSKLKKLPENLCELYNLQTLKLGYCINLKELPRGIGKLLKLRHLINNCTDSVSYMPKGIAELTQLRTLSEFHLCDGDYGGIACSLECLNNFPYVETLTIVGLRNRRKVIDEIVHLQNNEYIRALTLNFARSNSMKDEAILKALRPHPNLQRLTVYYYGGVTMFTLRMMAIANFRELNLVGLDRCVRLPALGRLPSLERLHISLTSCVRVVGNEFMGVERDDISSSSSSVISFPKLETLEFQSMGEWVVWDFDFERDTTIMPSLRTLKIIYCVELKGLPKQLLQMAPLQNLSIDGCPILRQLYEKGTGEKWGDISHIPNIQFT